MDVSEWERRIDQQLAELRDNGGKLAKAAAAVRGRGETRGARWKSMSQATSPTSR